jgi:hypothetical protein
VFLALINSGNLDPLLSLRNFSSLINCGHITPLPSLHRTSLTESHCYVHFLIYVHLILSRTDPLKGLVRSWPSAHYSYTPYLAGPYTHGQFLLRRFYRSRVYLRAHNFLWENMCFKLIINFLLLMKPASFMRSVFNWHDIKRPVLLSQHQFIIRNDCNFILSHVEDVRDL